MRKICQGSTRWTSPSWRSHMLYIHTPWKPCEGHCSQVSESNTLSLLPPLLTPTPIPPSVTLGTSGGGILGCEKSTSISSLCSGRSCPVAFRLLMRTLTETWFFYLKVISDCLLLLLIFITGRARLLFAPTTVFSDRIIQEEHPSSQTLAGVQA